MEDVFSTELLVRIERWINIAFLAYAEVVTDKLTGRYALCVCAGGRPRARRERPIYFVFRPDIKGALRMFRLALDEKAIGVFRRVKAAFRARQLDSHVFENVVRQPTVDVAPRGQS